MYYTNTVRLGLYGFPDLDQHSGAHGSQSSTVISQYRPGAAPQRVVGQSATPCAGGSARLYGRACQSDICI